MGRLGIHLTTVRVLIAQHVTGKFDDHHLHTQTDAEGGDILGTGVFRSDDLAFYATLAEARADDHALQALEFLRHVLAGDLLAVHKVQLGLHIVVDTCQVQTLADTLIGILQVVLTH